MKLADLEAISLKYPDNVEAPVVTAKAKGDVAKKMIEIAKENKIPVVEDKVLSNVLTLSEIGQCIPYETWEAVASIFAVIKELSKKEEAIK